MKNSILVIEDDPLCVHLIENRLKKEYTVIKKENGQEAVEWLEHNSVPNLIIADLNMPIMNGYQFISYIKSHLNLSKIPIVIISGENMLMLKNRCYRAGANKFLLKPLNMNELVFTIKDLLEKHELNSA